VSKARNGKLFERFFGVFESNLKLESASEKLFVDWCDE
jgi:hypothetical protein